MSGERQSCRPQELIARHPSARRDPPEGDLDDVLTPSCTVALDDVGELLLDPSEPQRRHAGPQHLAVQRVGEAKRRPPIRHHHRDEPPGLQRLERRQSVAALEVGQTEAFADRQQLEHRQPRRVDTGEVLVDELVERHRRRQVTDRGATCRGRGRARPAPSRRGPAP